MSGWEDLGLGKSGCDHYFQVSHFLFLCLGWGRRRGKKPHQPPKHPSTQEWWPNMGPGSWCGIWSKGFTQVVLIVLKCRSLQSKDEGTHSMSIGCIVHLRISIYPDIRHHVWAGVVVQSVLLSLLCYGIWCLLKAWNGLPYFVCGYEPAIFSTPSFPLRGPGLADEPKDPRLVTQTPSDTLPMGLIDPVPPMQPSLRTQARGPRSCQIPCPRSHISNTHHINIILSGSYKEAHIHVGGNYLRSYVSGTI